MVMTFCRVLVQPSLTALEDESLCTCEVHGLLITSAVRLLLLYLSSASQ
jgi:hypothetical protein